MGGLTATLRRALSLGCLAATGCAVPVAADLGDEEARAGARALERAGIAADVRRAESGAGLVVEVSRGAAERALRTLRGVSRPAASPTLLDALGDPGPVPSRLSERARLARGLAGDLERTLTSIDGVLEARVHVTLPERSALVGSDERDAPAKASALVVLQEGHAALDPVALRDLVAGAVPGLEPERVRAVVQTRARPEAPTVALARVGPIVTTSSSLPTLRAVVGGAALSNLGLLAMSLVLWHRSRRSAGEPPPRRP